MAIKREGTGVPDLLNACMRAKNLFMKLLWQRNCFYWWNCKDLRNWGFLESYIFALNWAISRVLISWELLFNKRVPTMEMAWWWCNLFSSFFVGNFLRNLNGIRHQNCQYYCKKTNQQFSMVWTLINQRNDAKKFKTLQWNHSPFLLSLNILALLLKSIRVLTMGRWCWFVIDG